MSWFKKKHEHCAVCRVLYLPDKWEATFPNRCHEHRKEALDMLQRREAVVQWATINWQKLEPMKKKEDAKNFARQKKNMERMKNAHSPYSFVVDPYSDYYKAWRNAYTTSCSDSELTRWART